MAARYLEENDDEQITVIDLVTRTRMKTHLESLEEPYSTKHMKCKWLEYFGDKIIITELNGKPNSNFQKFGQKHTA